MVAHVVASHGPLSAHPHHFRQPSPTARDTSTVASHLETPSPRLAARPRRSGLAHRSRLCSPREASLCVSVHASLLGTGVVPLLPPLPPPDALALAASPRSGGLAQRSALGSAPRCVGGLTALVVIAVTLVGGGGVGCRCETPRCAVIRSGLLVGLDAVGGGAIGTLSCTELRFRFPALLGLCCCCCCCCRRRSGH